MAFDDDRGDNEYEADILRHTGTVYRNMLVGLLVLVVSLCAFAVGFAAMFNFNTRVDELLAIKPENRAQSLSKRIAAVKSQVESQYADYEKRMSDDSIYVINRQFKAMYQVTLASERDYGKLLADYQQLSYQVASNIRGSGEWYYYYERELNAFIRDQERFESKLRDYLSRRER